MKISAPSPITRILELSALAKGRDKEPVQEQQPPPHNPAPAATSFAALIAVSQIEDDRERRRKMASECDEGLELLDSLRKELDMGNVPAERLNAMLDWLQRATPPNNGFLAAIFEQIVLRVSVELAKLGKL